MRSSELHPHFLIIKSKHKAFVTCYQNRCWFGQGIIIFVPGITTHKSYQYFFLLSFFCFFFNFVVSKLCQKKFHWFSIFFPEFTLLKWIFPISSRKRFSHSEKKIHPREITFFWTQFLLFFHSRFIHLLWPSM